MRAGHVATMRGNKERMKNFGGETSWKMSVWKTEEEIGWEVDGSVSVLC